MYNDYPFSKFQEVLQAIARKLDEQGYVCYVVGGAVRDHFLGKESLDIDLATNASPKAVSKIFKHTIPTGIAHGTVTVLYHNIPFEVTTFRSEGTYSDSRRPDNVEFIDSIDEDLKRRDYTINAIAYHILNNEFYDPLGGIDAIQRKELSAIGLAQERFEEDVLRILRGIRFIAQLDGFRLERQSAMAMQQYAPHLTKVSKERITKEFHKLIVGVRASYALELAFELGIIRVLFPALEFYHQKNVIQEQTLWQTLLLAIDYSPAELELRVAILLSALGEIESAVESYQVIFRSAKLAQQLLTQYKCSNTFKANVAHLIANQELILLDLWADGDIRRWLSRVGLEHVESIIHLNKALYRACKRDPYELERFYDRVKQIIAQRPTIYINQLAIGGKDLIELGVESGPQIGVLLQQLLELVIESPEFNTRKLLINAAIFFMST